jgi:hypothetical protein
MVNVEVSMKQWILQGEVRKKKKERVAKRQE